MESNSNEGADEEDIVEGWDAVTAKVLHERSIADPMRTCALPALEHGPRINLRGAARPVLKLFIVVLVMDVIMHRYVCVVFVGCLPYAGIMLHYNNYHTSLAKRRAGAPTAVRSVSVLGVEYPIYGGRCTDSSGGC